MKFLAGSKIWRENFKIYFVSKKKKILEEYIFQEISLQILENPKNFMILFFFLLGFNENIFISSKSFSFFSRSFSIFNKSLRFSKKSIFLSD